MKYLVDEITTNTNWDLSIVIPDQQRSWIGKAHFAGKKLAASYIYTQPSTSQPNDKINSYEGPFMRPEPKYHQKEWQEWCLINSTPAACADIGIHHLYSHSKNKPVDLVISGPNFGKNSSNLYILASGTVGAAMEAVTHGVKAIALSYAFNNMDHDYWILKEAAKISVKLIEKLYLELKKNEEIDMFSINVPLVDSLKLGRTKIHYAPIFKNTWRSIYSPLPEPNHKGQLEFSWTPDFKQVYKDGLEDFSHSDSRVLLDEGISVTPLKAAFRFIEPLSGEITLTDEEEESEEQVNSSSKEKNNKTFAITIPKESYIYEPLVSPFKKLGYTITQALPSPTSKTKIFHYGEYEDIDLDRIHEDSNYFLPSYIYRKALIRKHYLANTVHHYVTKHPESILKRALPESYQLEVDYAEFLDDALDDSYELRDEIEAGDRTWILKPSMSDKGQGIRIFKTIDQLQEIFNSFEEESDNEEEEDENKNGIILSQLRHFIVQEYKSNPLLLESYQNKKFHLRVYIVCQGDLKVYVYKNILTLFADSPYEIPEEDENDEIPMNGHLTNTCLQEDENPLVVPFWKLNDITEENKAGVFNQICEITKELFIAATSVDKMNFQPLENAIEIFGVDFLINSDYKVNLLEVNSYPDFKQTGDDLKEIIYELFARVAEEVVDPMIEGVVEEKDVEGDSNLIKVLSQ
ncbi:PBY1 [[Candida] subhashii]|uniref:PBY1 n=1 Tax=[Candida] subhashii TaxID=561895 RepID=A0A8J5QRP0_9ASCO|nr:PBY1 [[Candida] subhashii]KAG7665198.1 PBY1 [[Candida] subhashii]